MLKPFLPYLAFVCFFCIPNSACAQQISNTSSFITYFDGIENMVTYTKVKDSLERWGAEIKKNDKLTTTQKKDLQLYYNNVKSASQSLYDQLLADLTNADKRKVIRNDPTGYVKSLNKHFDAINESYKDFKGRYSQYVGAAKGALLIFLVKTFVLPFAKAFFQEVVNDVIRTQMDKKLKPLVVIKDWDTL